MMDEYMEDVDRMNVSEKLKVKKVQNNSFS